MFIEGVFTIKTGIAFMKRENIMKKYTQKGSVLIEYIIILSFIACLAIFFSYRSWGLDPYIHNAKQQIIAALGFGDGNNYEVAIVDKLPNFSGTKQTEGTDKVSGTINNKVNGKTEWTWRDLYTNDGKGEGDAACGSFFLDSDNNTEAINDKYFQNSATTSEYAEKLLAGLNTGSVDTTSWAFTEGHGENNQSLNLYWSNYNWSDFAGKNVPILQMNQEKPGTSSAGPTQYYVVMANIDNNGNIKLKNQAAALDGKVTYITQSGDRVELSGTKSVTNDGINRFETSSNQLSSSLAYSDFNSAQAAYMKAVQEFNQNNPGNQITMTK